MSTEDNLKEKQRELANKYKDKDKDKDKNKDLDIENLDTEIKRVSKLCFNNLNLLSKDPIFTKLVINEKQLKHRCEELRLLLSTFQKCVDENKNIDNKLYAAIAQSKLDHCSYTLYI